MSLDDGNLGHIEISTVEVKNDLILFIIFFIQIKC